ncbi:MAG: amino acid permease [Candidatus Bathyarchaeia archaeon]
MPKIELRSKLTLFDVTNLVVGAIIGADIYVASSLGAALLGPFSLVVWVIAGIFAIVIALCFAECAAMVPKVGGPYAYAREAWGPFAGFTVGWSLWLAEWISLAVFPVAFTQYCVFFLPGMDIFSQTAVKVLFIIFLIATNIFGVKAAGRTNDALTLAKLAPLIFFSAVGIIYVVSNTGTAASNFSPFSPFGLGNFGPALILIFWAYAGFEISTIPAGEIDNPRRTIPKAILLGISIVTVFYLTTNFVLLGVTNWSQLSRNAPLATATSTALGSIPTLALAGAYIVGIGALISIAGSDESGMIGTSRLGYALAADGLFPRAFARIHPKFKTPYLGIIIQSVTALVAAIVGGLQMLIATSVFFMSVAYAATSASVFWLHRKSGESQGHLGGRVILPSLGVIFSVYLISQCTPTQIAIGLALLLVGVPIYIKYSPKKEIAELKETLISREAILKRAYEQEHTFLAHALRHIKKYYRRVTGKKQTWDEAK